LWPVLGLLSALSITGSRKESDIYYAE